MKPCSRCDRHVRLAESVCPFCGAQLVEGAAPSAWGWAVGLALLGAACGPGKADSSTEGATTEASTGTSSTGSEATVTGAPTTGGRDTASGTSTSTSEAVTTECASCSSSSEGGAFIYAAPDMGPSVAECDAWVQDCPEGQKCVPVSADGDPALDSLHCAPVAEEPAQVGDPCTVTGVGPEQVDDCDLGQVCWNVDEKTKMGRCTAQCTGSPDAPTCADPAATCFFVSEQLLALCLSLCDPLQQDCAGSEVCVPNPFDSEQFVCVPDASGGGGPEFSGCEFINACEPGLTCLKPALAVECDPQATGCCLKFCDVTMPACAGAGAECVPWFEQGMAPAGLEDVGVCRLPP